MINRRLYKVFHSENQCFLDLLDIFLHHYPSMHCNLEPLFLDKTPISEKTGGVGGHFVPVVSEG